MPAAKEQSIGPDFGDMMDPEQAKKEYLENKRNEFKYHPPTKPEQKQAHEAVNAAAEEMLEKLVTTCPIYTPQLEIALKSLMECKMWANAAIAINMNKPD